MSQQKDKTPPAKFKPGELIVYKAKDEGMVQDVIDSRLGYNLYKITLFNGMDLTVSLTQLSAPPHPLQELVGEDDIQDQDVVIEVEEALQCSVPGSEKSKTPAEPEAEPVIKKKRYVQMSEDNLDELSKNRLSKGTIQQTVYGVKVFTGRYHISVFMCCLYLKRYA